MSENVAVNTALEECPDSGEGLFCGTHAGVLPFGGDRSPLSHFQDQKAATRTFPGENCDPRFEVTGPAGPPNLAGLKAAHYRDSNPQPEEG